MKTKGLLSAVFLAAVVLSLQTTAFAADLDYSGPINSFTGEPIDETGSPRNEDRVPVAAGIHYDHAEHAYIYDFADSSGEYISASVSDGMIVNEAVRISPSQGLEVRLYRDGKLVQDIDLSLIDVPGRYVLEARTRGAQYMRVTGFTIVGSTTCLISSYLMPSGFVVTGVDMAVKDANGQWVTAQAQWDRSSVSMSKDGAYRVHYECVRNGLSYTLQTIVDHTPPTLALSNVINGLAKGPVDISDLEEGCKIGITLNGGKLSYREELTLSGNYEIILMDPAGNLTNYEFTILLYFDANSWLFFALAVLLVAGTGVYLYIERKRMRVR